MKTKLLKKIRKRFIVYKLDGRFVYLDRKNDEFSESYRSIYSCIIGILISINSYYTINLMVSNERKRINRLTLKKAVHLCKK